MFLEQEKTANRAIKKRKESFFPFFWFLYSGKYIGSICCVNFLVRKLYTLT